MHHTLTCDGCTLWADFVAANAENAKSAELDVIRKWHGSPTRGYGFAWYV